MDKNYFTIKKLIGKKWLILLFNTVFFALMAWLLPIHFEENDDVVMCMIANGVCSGTPNGHLVFINALYGWVLASLYRLSKVVEWYTLLFCIIHIFAMSIIFFMIIKDQKISLLFKGLFLVFIYVIWVDIIIAFEFTTTAGLLCFSGCMALLQPNRKWRVLGVCAVFVSSLIRFQAAGLVGLLFAPLLTIHIIKNKQLSYFVVIAVLSAVLGQWADGLFYKQPEWLEYRAYNAIRGKINDNPNIYLLEESDLPNGIDLEDYHMFCNFEGDPKIMTLAKLQEIKTKIDNKRFNQSIMPNIINQLSGYRRSIVLLCMGLLLCIIMSFGWRPKLGIETSTLNSYVNVIVWAYLFSFILGLFIMAYISSNSTLKNRVFLCMLMPLSYLLVKSIPYYSNGWISMFKLLMVCVMIGLIVKYVDQDKIIARGMRNHQKEFDVFQAPLLNDKDKELLCYPHAFKIECLSPFKIKDINYRVVGFGWLSNIPFQKGLLESHFSFVDSDIVYYGLADTPRVSFQNMIEKNYGVKTQIETIDRNQKYALYKLVSSR